MNLRRNFARLTNAAAAGTMLVRAGIVAVNFAVMMVLAAWLGLGTFGTLAYYWSIALVAGTALSLGGPLILLRSTTDGRGIAFKDVIWVSLVYPAILAALAFGPLSLIWPGLPWQVLLVVALGVNLFSCLASVLRGMGSVQGSMIFRDTGPQLALGVAILMTGGDVVSGLAVAAALMALMACVIVLWISIPHRVGPISRSKDMLALWGASVLGVGVAQADLIVGGLILPPEVFGLYALLRRIANLVALPITVATWVSAAPVSAAFGEGDMQAVQRASAAGSRIAILSGGALFLAGVLALFLVPLVAMPQHPALVQMVLAILLVGGIVQVWFASGQTVATLCGFARYAAWVRLGVVASYLAVALGMGHALTAPANALAFVVTTGLGSLALWYALRRATGVDTSAAVLVQRRRTRWRTS